jgi:hypothetical protein
VSTGAGPQAGPGRRTARRASRRTRPDAPPPRLATVWPTDSQAPPWPRHRPGRLSPEVPRSQANRCERGTPSAPQLASMHDRDRLPRPASEASTEPEPVGPTQRTHVERSGRGLAAQVSTGSAWSTGTIAASLGHAV